jgi:hypothetical protein
MQIKNKGIVGLVVGLAVGLAIGVVVSLQAGPLTPPPTAVSGGAPVSTMKTLDQVPPTWDRTLPANNTGDPCNSSRFTCVMGNEAVKDNETGVVWHRSPFGNSGNWLEANRFCDAALIANRKGWRLPTVHELTSLIDPTQSNPALPSGHPFSGGASPRGYWSVTTDPSNANNALRVIFDVANQGGNVTSSIKNATGVTVGFHDFWCVRGGSGPDVR